MYVAHGENRSGRTGRERLGHRFVARLPAGQILFGRMANVVGVLWNKAEKTDPGLFTCFTYIISVADAQQRTWRHD